MSETSSRHPDSALLPIGDFEAVLPGRRRRSPLQGGPLQIVYGNDRENVLQGTSESRSPVVLVGGDKGDTYRVAPGQLSIVADLAEAPEPGDDDKPDTLDLTAIDRSVALWGYFKIGNDILMTDVVSGMATLLHDPFGVESTGNAIERVKVQYRDPVTEAVDPSKSQFISMTDWLTGGPGTIATLPNLGLYLEPLLETDLPGAVVDGVIVNYDAYNAITTSLRATPDLDTVLGDPLLVGLLTSLPTTIDLGLPTHQSVQDAWAAAAGNLDLID